MPILCAGWDTVRQFDNIIVVKKNIKILCINYLQLGTTRKFDEFLDNNHIEMYYYTLCPKTMFSFFVFFSAINIRKMTISEFLLSSFTFYLFFWR